MAKLFEQDDRGLGLPPGTLVHVGKERTEKVRITVIDYSEAKVEERELAAVSDCAEFADSSAVTWINVDGIHDMKVIEEIGQHFGLHALLLEDVANANQRAKTEDYEDHIFTVLKMLYCDRDTGEIGTEQVSLVLGANVVISFQEEPGDVFDGIRDRIRNGKGRIRAMGADYLMYSLIDAVVDNYFVILEWVGERIDAIEEEVHAKPTPKVAMSIQSLKKEMLSSRKAIWPLREVVSGLQRGESPLIQKETVPFFRDVYDHVIQVIDTSETCRDMVAALRDTYLTVISNRMNEVMKVLTIIATIFMPLTFIAGIYGMNFDVMPETKYAYGYPICLATMAVVGVLMLVYFRRKNWL
jgi:magnesium transporter